MQARTLKFYNVKQFLHGYQRQRLKYKYLLYQANEQGRWESRFLYSFPAAWGMATSVFTINEFCCVL